MKEEDIKKKYKDEIIELGEVREKIMRDYQKVNEDFEKFIENITKVEGELPYLKQDEFNYRMEELVSIVKNAYKNINIFYKEILDINQEINNLHFWLRVIFDSVDELEEVKGLKEKYEKKMEQYDKDAPFINELKNYLEAQIEKQEKVAYKKGAEIG